MRCIKLEKKMIYDFLVETFHMEDNFDDSCFSDRLIGFVFGGLKNFILCLSILL